MKLNPYTQLALDLTLAVIALALFAFGLAQSPMLTVPAVVLIGVAQHRLYMLGHESAHALFDQHNLTGNDRAGRLAFGLLLIPLDGFRVFHFGHHRHSGTKHDPEMKVKAGLGEKTQGEHCPRDVGYSFLLDLIGGGIAWFATTLRVMWKDCTEKDGHESIILWGVVITISIAAGVWWVPVVWLVALLTVYTALSRLRLAYEHKPNGATRYIRANWLQRATYLPHNAWCHKAHHDHPYVPTHDLPNMAWRGWPYNT